MKVLIFTRSPWDDSNSVGNTMTNIWAGWSKNEIANIYFREAKPNTDVCYRYFSISEQDLLKKLFKFNYNVGKYFEWTVGKQKSPKETRSEFYETILYNIFRKKSNFIFDRIRELLWKFGGWKSESLNHFLEVFKPEIVFSPAFYTCYTYDVLWFIKKKTNAKIVLFHADDYITHNRYAGSFLNKISDRINSRFISESARKADLNYCISPKQQLEYAKLLNLDIKLLYKGAEFVTMPFYHRSNSLKPLNIVYIGSTLYGRWKTLAMIALAIKEINEVEEFFKLKIFSQYNPSRRASKAMIVLGASEFYGKIPASEVGKQYEQADIVLHVESFDKHEKFKTRLSFSTKLVDCFHSARCLIAVGWEEAASIEYLKQNNAALIANNPEDVKRILQGIKDNPSLLEEYSQKAWEFGKLHHNIEQIQARLKDDLEQLLKE